MNYLPVSVGTVFYIAGFGARIILDKEGCMKKNIFYECLTAVH
jgi:hypothetical protein